MSANKQCTGPSGNEPQGQRASARRRLLRGSFAAPVVLTLSSGSALANTSSSMRCFNNSPSGVDDTSSNANYFRVARYTLTDTSGTVFLVRASDIKDVGVARKFSTTFYLGSKVWLKLDGSEFTLPSGVTPPSPDGRSVALRFVNSGSESAPAFALSGLSSESGVTSGSGKVMSSSCWNSFT